MWLSTCSSLHSSSSISPTVLSSFSSHITVVAGEPRDNQLALALWTFCEGSRTHEVGCMFHLGDQVFGSLGGEGVRMIWWYKMIQILLKMKEVWGPIIQRELLQALVLLPAVSSEMLLLISLLHCNLYCNTARSLLLQYYM